MKLKIKQGTTSKLVRVFVQDSAATDGSGKTGIAYNATGLTAYYLPEGDATATAITLASGTVGTYSSGGWSEVDSTNMPGIYELGLPDAAVDATSEGSVVVMLKGATDMAPVLIEIELDAVDYKDATDFGLSNLDAAISTRSTVAATDIVSGGAITTSGGAVSNVTLVATTTTNTDMRGTDGANTVAPDNASIAAILTDTGTTIPASISALNDLSQADVRTAVGLASANLDTQLGDIPTVSEFNARTLVAAAYFDPATDTVTVGQNNDKTGYALSSAANDAIGAAFLAYTLTKGSPGTIERAFWQSLKATQLADGEVSGTPTASAFDTNLTAVSGAYDHLLILFTSGSLAGEARPIDSYSATNGRITLQEPLTSAPSSADEFIIVPDHSHPVAEVYQYFVSGSNEDAFKADVSALATQASVDTIDVNVDAIKVKTDQLTFTNPNSVDATATADVDEAAIADAVIAGIGGTDVTISSVIAEDGTTITIVRGDDYSASDSRAITWTGTTDDQWPSLSGATLKFTAKNNMDSLTVTPTVTQPTGTQAFRMELTSTNTEIMSGRYKYDVQATLSSGRVITLVVGEMIVKQTYTDRP